MPKYACRLYVGVHACLMLFMIISKSEALHRRARQAHMVASHVHHDEQALSWPIHFAKPFQLWRIPKILVLKDRDFTTHIIRYSSWKQLTRALKQ